MADKQDIINDNDLSISKTLNLQSSLDAKQNTINQSSAVLTGSLQAIGQVNCAEFNLLSSGTDKNAYLSVLADGENFDAIIYLGTPFDQADAAKKCAFNSWR